MPYTIEDYLNDIQGWPEAEPEIDSDAEFEYDSFLYENGPEGQRAGLEEDDEQDAALEAELRDARDTDAEFEHDLWRDGME